MSENTENGLSRQRVVRIPLPIDDWLKTCARRARQKDVDSRAGIATEINAILERAFSARKVKS